MRVQCFPHLKLLRKAVHFGSGKSGLNEDDLVHDRHLEFLPGMRLLVFFGNKEPNEIDVRHLARAVIRRVPPRDGATERTVDQTTGQRCGLKQRWLRKDELQQKQQAELRAQARSKIYSPHCTRCTKTTPDCVSYLPTKYCIFQRTHKKELKTATPQKQKIDNFERI